MRRPVRALTLLLMAASWQCRTPSRDSPLAATDDIVPGRILAVTEIQETPRSQKISEEFVGLSLEYGIEPFFSERSLPAETFINLLKNLKHGVLRMGGVSEETNCWASLSPVCTEQMDRPMMERLFRIVSAADWSLILGTSLAANDPESTVAFARAMQSLAQRYRVAIRGLELGNEPDWAYVRDGLRAPTYTLRAHAWDTQRYITALRRDPVTRDIPITGPAFTDRWIDRLGEWLRDLGEDVHAYPFVTEHLYQLDPCRACPTDSRVPCQGCTEKCALCEYDPANPISGKKLVSYRDLLDEDRMAATVAKVKGYAAQARAHGVGYRMAETNSVNACGLFGISDTLAAALWTTDILFRYAQLGIEGVNFHNANGCPYNFIVAAVPPPGTKPPLTEGNRGRPPARSPYYGLLLFSNAVGEYLLDTSATTISTVLGQDGVARRANVSVYATTACATCDIKVFVINKDMTANGAAIVVPPAGARSGTVLHLAGPGLTAMESEIAYGGVRVDEQTGKLPEPQARRVHTNTRGQFVVKVPQASAVMLTISRGPEAR